MASRKNAAKFHKDKASEAFFYAIVPHLKQYVYLTDDSLLDVNRESLQLSELSDKQVLEMTRSILRNKLENGVFSDSDVYYICRSIDIVEDMCEYRTLSNKEDKIRRKL